MTTGSALAQSKAKAKAPPIPLVWHVEAADGEVLDTRNGDVAINPASVVKVATSLWALERLGPEHRFETEFLAAGPLDSGNGVLGGDLIVRGGADPDFHTENGFRVVQALSLAGLVEVHGSVVVDEQFWMGWEGGSARPIQDPSARSKMMAKRFSDVFDSRRWSRSTRSTLASFAARQGVDLASARIVLNPALGSPTLDGETKRVLVTHASNPLVPMLKRFNAYSNNDIERFEATLGTAEELERFLAARGGDAPESIQLETLSGLGYNRMTPRRIVGLLRDLRATCNRLGLKPLDVLPVAGCDPGTLTGYHRLGSAATKGCFVGKTGTLTTTDGGVAVLAGFLDTERGPVLFCVAAPGAAGRILTARRRIEAWVLELAASLGGARPGECGPGVGYSDDRIRLSISHPVGS